MAVLGWTLLALLLALMALLTVPVNLSFRIRRGAPVKASLTVFWMFGLVSFPIRRGGCPVVRRPKKRAKSRRFPPRFIRVFGKASFRARFVRFLRQVIASFNLRDFRLRMRLGFEDPAETGLLWALLAPLVVVFDRHPNASLDVAPEFAGERFEVETQGQIGMIPARLAWVFLIFALSPATVRAVWGQWVRA